VRLEAEGVGIIAPADGSTRNGGGNCVPRGVSGAIDVGTRVAAGLESVRLATGDDPTEGGVTEEGLAGCDAPVNVEAVSVEALDGEVAGAVKGERETTGFAATFPVVDCTTPVLPAAPADNGRAELVVAVRALPALAARLRCAASLCSRIDARVGIVKPELMRAPVAILFEPLLGTALRSLLEVPAEDARRSAK